MASKLANIGIEWDDDSRPIGFQIGRNADIAEWRLRKEIDDPAFKKLVAKLSWRKNRESWRAKQTPERLKEIRDKWRTERPEEAREAARRSYNRRKSDKAVDARMRKWRSDYWKQLKAKEWEGVEYTCGYCFIKWRPDPSKRLPPRGIVKWCSQKCRTRASYLRRSERKRMNAAQTCSDSHDSDNAHNDATTEMLAASESNQQAEELPGSA